MVTGQYKGLNIAVKRFINSSFVPTRGDLLELKLVSEEEGMRKRRQEDRKGKKRIEWRVEEEGYEKTENGGKKRKK